MAYHPTRSRAAGAKAPTRRSGFESGFAEDYYGHRGIIAKRGDDLAGNLFPAYVMVRKRTLGAFKNRDCRAACKQWKSRK